MILVILDDEKSIFRQERYVAHAYAVLKPTRPGSADNPAFNAEPIWADNTGMSARAPILREIALSGMELQGAELQGKELANLDLEELILEQNPGIGILYIANRNTDASEALEQNPAHFSLKPVAPDQVTVAIHRVAECMRQMDSGVAKDVCIQTFNRFEVFVSGLPLKWNRSKARELIALLIHRAGRKIGKFTICDLLWPDNDPVKALVQLQTTVCALRKCLSCISREAMSIEYSNDGYRLKLGNVQCDKVQFLDFLESYRKTKDIHYAKDAVLLHGSGYFSDEPWSWALEAAEDLYAQYARLVSDIEVSDDMKTMVSDIEVSGVMTN